MTARDPSPAVVTCRLLAGLSDVQRDALLSACSIREYRAGETVIQAGTLTPGLHIIESGSAQVMAVPRQGGEAVAVATLSPGEVFGELSTLTGGSAMATVRAAATPTRLHVVSASSLARLQGEHDLVHALMRNVIRIDQQRLADNHGSYLRQLEQTLELLQQRHSAARLFVLVLVLMSTTILTNHWLHGRPGLDVYAPSFAWAMLLTIVLPTLLVAWHEKYPWWAMGLTTRNLGRDLATSAAIVVVVLVLGVGGLWLADYPLAERFNPAYLVRYGPLYTLHSALQEFVGRGLLLGMLLHAFGGRTWQHRQAVNVAVSLMFGLTHIHFGLPAVALSLVFSLLLGSYYMIWRNLAGPTLIHAVLGLAAFMLGLI